MNTKKSSTNFFQKWFLNNRFSVALLNILLFFLIILVFNKISFILNPFWTFFNAILPPILVAVIQYYLMNPVVDFLEKKLHFPRILTIGILYLIVVGLLVWIITSIVPVLQRQTDSLVKNWPNIWNDAQTAVEKLLRDPHLSKVKGNLNQAVSDAQAKIFKSGQESLNLAINNVLSAVNVLTMIFMTLLTAPFVLFFMLKDGHQLKPYITKVAPKNLQESFASLLHDINHAVASYVRGQITVAFWVGVMFAIGYSIIGLPYGVTLAVAAGFLNMIPYFGTFIAIIPALILGIMNSPMMLLKVIIVFAVEQTIEGRVISPLVMGNKMNMNPVTTILLLIGASAVSGLWGVIFAIPVYAVVKIIVTRIFKYYQKMSTFYQNGQEKETGTDDNSVGK
ncbi:AI-2E family transporter [Lactobacillus sp. PV037]|uniref:AI-2E family transporter n=1 Tax=unclassified Lactobacillus TaxID=2620435 RepID=UPI00224096B0|nr:MULTISPECIES: AI-2E family transporter [unclassified Lactobacillus]QNQ82581.1 AI-2E family transporter [Lactobacillus sp. PV012]QNQ83304.1 AI-2E family transporter [Lactobacillus sp. PV037]